MTTLRSMVTLGLCLGAFGAARADVTYKCPNHVYSNTMSAKEAKDKGCTVLDNPPITVIQGYRPRDAGGGTASPPSSTARVDPNEQRARDSDARRILEDELKREEDRLAGLRQDYKNGQPDRLGDEKNYQKYLDRVADMKAAIARSEGDIAALKRELAKTPQ